MEIGTAQGALNLAQGSAIDVQGGDNGDGGKVVLRAPRTGSGAGTDVAVGSIAGSIGGAGSVVVEAVKVYDNITTLSATGASAGTLSLDTVNTDNTSFASNAGTIASRLGKSGDAVFHVRAGVEVRSTGDLALSNNWNLATRPAGEEPGMLTLRAAGNLNLDNHLSDGFNVATPFSSGTTPATLVEGDSWGYRLVAGADADAADPLAVKAGSGDITLAAGKLVRTGTGDIHLAAGGDIKLVDNKSAIYTAGRIADTAAGFVVPANAQFSQGGGDVSLVAMGNITGAPSAQLYSNWLFRQGAANSSTGEYTRQPAWWVRFDQFQQGVGALGGGNVTLQAGGKVENVSASAPTQARMTATAPDAVQAGDNRRRRCAGENRGRSAGWPILCRPWRCRHNSRRQGGQRAKRAWQSALHHLGLGRRARVRKRARGRQHSYRAESASGGPVFRHRRGIQRHTMSPAPAGAFFRLMVRTAAWTCRAWMGR